MRQGVRIVLASMAVALALTASGCKGVTPPSMRDDQPAVQAPAPAPASSAGVASASATAKPAPDNTAGDAPSVAPTLTAGEYASSITSAGVAVGGELERNDQFVVAGRIWAMTVDGTQDTVTDQPRVQLVAVNANGSMSVIAEIVADKGASAIQGGVSVPIPAGTNSLRIQTSLRSPKAGDDAPMLAFPLADIPVVQQLPVEQ